MHNSFKAKGKVGFFLLLIGWLNPAFGQDKFIALKKDLLEIPSRDFYIQAVIDARKNRRDIGVAQVGLFNKKVRMKFTQSAEAELLGYFQAALPQQADQRPVIVKLLALEAWERTSVFSETAFATARMEFYIEQDGRFGKVYAATADHKRGALDVTKFHEANLRLVVTRCVQDFSKSNWRIAAPMFVDSITEANEPGENFEPEQTLAHWRKRYRYSLGAGGLGVWQQNDMPMDFGNGVRIFFSYRDLRRLRFELGMDYVFARPMSDDRFFAFGNDEVLYAFTQGRQLNFDLTGKIALADYPRNAPYFLMNFGATSLHSTDGKVFLNGSREGRDAKVSISGITFGGGLGYQHYLSKRVFIDGHAVFNLVVIRSATGDGKTGKLPESTRSEAQTLRVQLGFDF